MARNKRGVRKNAARQALRFTKPATWLPSGWQPSELPTSLVNRMRAGVSQPGHLGRLRQALSRIDQGAPLTMAVIGSSLTADFAGVVGSMQDRFQLGYIGTPARCKKDCVRLGWVLPVFRFLTQHSNQSTASSVINAGQAARYMSNYVDCTSSVVPAEVDLVILDGVNGMSPIVGNMFMPTEKLLRRLLALPHRPALVVLHWIDWCTCAGPRCTPEPRIFRHRNRSCYTAEGFNHSWTVSQHREHVTWTRLARHYNITVLSLSRAFHPFAEQRRGRGAYTSAEELANWTWDGLHPKPCDRHGLRPAWQKCHYTLLVASLINIFFADVRSGHLGSQADEREPLPVPCKSIKARAKEGAPTRERCFGWGLDRYVPPSASVISGWRQTWMDTAVSFEPPSHCRRSRNALPPSCPKPKAGLTAFVPGSRVILELPLSTAHSIIPETGGAWHMRSWNATLALTYLSSYEGMGAAVISCVSQCHCTPTMVDAHRASLPDGHASSKDSDSTFISVWERESIPVVLTNPGPCKVQVMVNNHTRSGRHKFKLSTLTLHWSDDQSQLGLSTPSCTPRRHV